MMRSLWTSKTGMEAQQTQLDAISHNLANASTNGYKKSHVVFEDLMYQNLRQAGAASTEQTTLPTGLQVGLGTRAVDRASRRLVTFRHAIISTIAESAASMTRNTAIVPPNSGGSVRAR